MMSSTLRSASTLLLTTLCVAGTSAAAPRAGAVEPLPQPRHDVWWPAGAAAPVPVPFSADPLLRAEVNPAPSRPFPANYPVAARAAWTFVVFMDGDNDLEEYTVKDLETELGRVGSTNDVNVIVVADRHPGYDDAGGDWSQTLLFHVQEGQVGTADGAIADLGERNMGDPQTLAEALTWTGQHFPSDHTALVFWDHGWDWRPGNTLVDESDADALDVDEMGEALAAAGPVDVIGFDACMMASLEVQAIFRPHARAFVGSQDYVGWDGFEYGEILAALTADPRMDAEDLARVMAESMSQGDSRTVSAVALDLSFDRLVGAVDTLGGALADAHAEHGPSMKAAWIASQHFSGDMVQRDLYDLALELEARVGDAAVKRAAQEVMAAVDGALLYEWHRRPYRDAHGITLYWPGHEHDRYSRWTSGTDDFAYYRGLPLGVSTRWDDFLATFTAR